MTEKEIPSRQAADLRRQAENIVREKTIRIPENINALSPEETRQTLHELQVHQIELEIQNEELRRTQMELDAARAKYFDLYDLAPIGYVTINEKGQIVEANLAAATLLGAARGNLLKQLFSRFVHPEDQDIYYHTRKRLFKDPSPISLQADQAGETQVTLELRMEKMDRMAFWAHMEATAALDDDGAPLCRIVIVDITNRKKAEEDLKLFKSIVEKSSEAIAISNSGGCLIFINHAHEKLFARSLAAAQQHNYRDYYPPESIEILNNEVAPALERGESWEGELDVFDAAGRKFTLWERADSILDAKGQLMHGFGFMHDISDCKRAEEALRESETKLQAIFDTVGTGILIIDKETQVIIEANQTAVEMIGLPKESIIGQICQSVVCPAQAGKCPVKDLGQSIDHSERKLLCADGHQKDILKTVYPITLNGKDCYIESFIDITAKKQLEEKLKSSEENFRTFFNTLDDMIIVGSPDGKIIYTNQAVTLKLGYSSTDIDNMYVLDVHPADKRQEAELIFSAMFKDEQDSCPLPLQSKDGALVPVETRVWFGKWSGVDCIFGISKDLTREQEALQKFNRLFSSNPAPMAVSSIPEQRFTDVNEAFLSKLGYSRSEVIGKTSYELDIFILPEKQREAAAQLQLHGRIANCELKVKCKDGTILDGLFSGEIIDNQGQKFFLTVMVDQTERKRYEKKLEYLATHDQLTGLLNRRSFEDMLSRTIAKAKRGLASSLLYIDLDNFKEVNDSAGHYAGDEVLITFAGLLKDAVRAEDVVFRLGGDEFAVLLDGIDGKEAFPAAERLRSAVEGHRFELEGRVFPLTLSIGIKEIDGAVTTGELMSQADIAMYQAKEQGKNRVVIS